jgi:hypothetical protein
VAGGFQWPAIDCDCLHGSPGFSIATQASHVTKGRIQKIFEIVRIVVLDNPVESVDGAVADLPQSRRKRQVDAPSFASRCQHPCLLNGDAITARLNTIFDRMRNALNWRNGP